MKRIKSILLIFALVLVPVLVSLAQEPPHPGGSPEGTHAAPVGGPSGGGAPIGDGGAILVVMAIAYGLMRYSKNEVLLSNKPN